MKMYSAKEAPPSVEERGFPMMIGHKSASVKIYRHPNRGVESYTISYHSEGARQKQMRRDFVEAFTLAQHMALKIGDGASNVLTLDGRDRFIYERSVQLATQTGMELDVLVARAVEAVKIAGGPELLVEAARLYEAQHRGVVQKVVADVVAELIQDRRSRGRSELYLRDLRVRLEQRFASAFKVPISSVTSRDIEIFLNAVKGGPRTKKNFLTAIGTLFAFAKRRGYLPEIHPGVSKVEFDAEVVVDIQIFTAEDMEVYLNAAKPELLSAVAIGAFAGLRSEELKRLDWSCVHIEEKHIEVPAKIAKTKTRRVVPLSDNLRRWLLPYRKQSGRVFPFANLAIQFNKLSKKTGIPWKRNGLRHSFISYRVAKIDKVDKVALEAGNSATVIRSNYLKMVTKANWTHHFTPALAAASGSIFLRALVAHSRKFACGLFKNGSSTGVADFAASPNSANAPIVAGKGFDDCKFRIRAGTANSGLRWMSPMA
jgi:integrase